MSGGASVVLSVIAAISSTPAPNWVFWVFAGLCFLSGSYFVWAEEYKARTLAEEKLAEKEAEPTQQKLTELERRYSQLLEQQPPRKLSQEQIDILLVRFKTGRQSVENATYRVLVPPSDSEAFLYAQKIVDVFREAQWTGQPGRFQPETQGSPREPRPPGLDVLVRDPEKLPLLTKLVISAFEEAGIQIGRDARPKADDKDDFVTLIVGPKPRAVT